MWNGIGRLFRRYAARHLALETTGPELRDATGRLIGKVDLIALRDDHILVTGHAEADLVTLELRGRRRAMAPKPQAGGQRRFHLRLPLAAPAAPMLGLEIGDQRDLILLRGFSPARLLAGRVLLLPAFLRDGLRALPAAVRWQRDHDMADRERVKRFLRLNLTGDDLLLDSALFSDGPPLPAPHSPGRIKIIMPVYNAFDLLPEVLDRVRRHTDLPWHLIVIEDASPDARVRPFLHGWARDVADEGKVTVIENDSNLGFVGSANRGLALVLADTAEPEAPVILLNSDALVPAGWASRLIRPILADATVASVTPMSNDAELMSVPVVCASTGLSPGEGDRIDQQARRFDPLQGLAETPTGVGFCMAMNPHFLRQVPAFDAAFGRGYGEEVDWCQKVRAGGGRHLCLPSLFVEHRGGTSFGSAEKARLLRQNGALIAARYPRFDTEVQRFIADDPLIAARLGLGLAWAGARCEGPVPVYLAHAMAGGAEHYLTHRIAADLVRCGAAVVVRVGGNSRWQIELHSPAGITCGGTDDRDLVLRLLAALPARNVVYSCGVGDADPIELPDFLLALAQDDEEPGRFGGHRIEVLFHDYLPLSPAYTLLGADGTWRGLPRPLQAPQGHTSRRPDGSRIDLAEWQAAWGRLLAAADAVVVFSEASRALVVQAYPQVEPSLIVQPHQHFAELPQRQPGRGGTGHRPVIGVLGNIAAHKGAAVLSDLSRKLAGSKQADLVLIGDIDPAYSLARPARVHGAYQVSEIPALIAQYGITCWLIPSVWPETFSYATHEALATGLPVICFDLGAQGEAVARAVAGGGRGALAPLRDGRADIDALLERILQFSGNKPS